VGLTTGNLNAQTSSTPGETVTRPSHLSQFFELALPPHLDATPFAGGVEAGGFSPERYQVLDQGLQLEQSVTKGISLAGRVTGYQLFIHGNFSNPLQPNADPKARLNFARLQGGVELSLLPDTHLFVLCGRDVGDSTASNIEGDLYSWLLAGTAHPSNVLVSVTHDYGNGITSSETDFRVIILSGADYSAYLGAGGAIYGGGLIPVVQGQGGAILAGCGKTSISHFGNV
jgi:hypothetical protein